MKSSPLATIDIHDRSDSTEVVVMVSECFEIKEQLKEMSFYWSPEERVWTRRVTFQNDAMAQDFIDNITAKLKRFGCEVE